MFDAQAFSRELKIQKAHYLSFQAVDRDLLESYIQELHTFDLGSLRNDAEKKAFWINVYNGMVNYVIITYHILNSMKEIDGIFRKKIFSIVGLEFSLDDVEHGILRRNQRNIFTEDDPKRALMLEKLDYRIHFALNCGAQSCPMISFYSASTIEQELAMAEEVFVAQEFEVDHVRKKISCSQIFDWYSEDFEDGFLDDPKFAGYSVSFRTYNWSVIDGRIAA